MVAYEYKWININIPEIVVKKWGFYHFNDSPNNKHLIVVDEKNQKKVLSFGWIW